MEKKRIAHLADLHLNGSDPSTALRCLEYAYAAALAHEVDAVVIAGDIWDRRIVDDDTTPLVPALRMTRELAQKVPVVMVYGNVFHDARGSLGPFAELSPNIFVFDRPTTALIAGIDFFCVPAVNKANIMAHLASSDQDATDAEANELLRRIMLLPAERFLGADPFGCPRVTVYHGNVTGCRLDNAQVLIGGDIMISAMDLEASGADYVALGHIHARQQLGEKCHYSGSLYHCNYGEHGAKSIQIVDVWRGGYEIVAVVETPSRAKITVDTVALDDGLCAIADDDQALMRSADVKIRVKMTPEQSAVFQKDLLERFAVEVLGANSATVEPIIIPTDRVRCEAITETRMLRDKVAAWGGATSTEIPAGVLDKADVLEGGAR